MIFEFINHHQVTFSSARTSPNFSHFPHQVKHVCFPLILHQRETRKIFSIISMTQRIIWTRSLIFYYLLDMNIYTQNLLVCNSSHYIYVTGLCNFFFVFKILLTESVLIFREQLFRRTCFLLASNTLHHSRKLPVSIKHEILLSFKKRVILILLCQGILETRKIYLHGSALFTIP